MLAIAATSNAAVMRDADFDVYVRACVKPTRFDGIEQHVMKI